MQIRVCQRFWRCASNMFYQGSSYQIKQASCWGGSLPTTLRLFNILNICSSCDPEAVVSLDAEKAFDRVEWDFLFEVMERFGLGLGFISWVKQLYSTPVASVRTNNTTSHLFQLHRGTRQGCLLSPLLFAIAIGCLATLRGGI